GHVVVRSVSSFTLRARTGRASAAKHADVIHIRASQGAVRHITAALLMAASAAAHAQTAFTMPPVAQALSPPPEASFEQRIDPWSRWNLRLYAEPAPGGDAAARGGIQARLLTRRLDTHQLQAGAAVAFSQSGPDPVASWQTFDDRRTSVFVEDRWQWSSALSVT